MPATIEDFKRAFSGAPSKGDSKDPFKTIADQVSEQLKHLNIKLLDFEKSGGSGEKHRKDLVKLVKDFDSIQKKDADSGKKKKTSEVDKLVKDLEKIFQSAMQKAAEVAKEAADRLTSELEKARAKAALEALEKLPKEALKHVQKELKQAKSDFAAGEKLEKAGKYGEAALKFRKAADDATTAKVKSDALSGKEPSKEDFKKLMDMAGTGKGKNRLDELILQLPDKTQQKVFKAAIEARFGVKVGVFKTERKVVDGKVVDRDEDEYQAVDLNTPNKSLRSIYEMLTKVPDAHSNADKNPSLKRILHFTQDDGSAAYWGKNKTVYMNVSRGKGIGDDDVTSEISTGKVGSTNMFPDGRDKDCMPKNTKVKTPFFDWATLHEVGHSVDDKHGFMDKNGKNSGYGKWAKETADTVAKVAADHFKWDKAYIAALLNNPKATPAVPAKLKKKDGWEDVKKKVDEWCAAVVVGEEMWMDGVESKKRAIDKRVYHEAYGGDWVSYEYAARSQGIHGYQFRAPGEWFAELYAAFYSDKLKDKHPAVEWLKKLETAKAKKAKTKK